MRTGGQWLSLCTGGVMIELILTVCLATDSATCKVVRLPYVNEGQLVTPYSCAMGAMPEIAKWSEEHPQWKVTRWACGVAGKNADI